MAIEIVDGQTGTAHISSEDLAPLNIGITGKPECVFRWGEEFKLTMSSANRGSVASGAGMVKGLRFWGRDATSVSVDSGTQGQKRNDLVVARYAKSGRTESVSLVVVKGTPSYGSASDPRTEDGDLKLWRIPLDGISVGQPVKLFEALHTLADMEAKAETAYIYQSSDGYVQCRRRGTYVTLSWDFSKGGGDAWTVGPVPADMRPGSVISGASVAYQKGGYPVDHAGGYMYINSLGNAVFTPAYYASGIWQTGTMSWTI